MLEARNQALESQVKQLSDAAAETRLSEAFETYRDTRKLTANDREVMALTLKSAPQLFEKTYPRPKTGPAYLLRKLSDVDPNTATQTGLKPVPDLAVILSDVKAKNPGLDYDSQFDLALGQHKMLLGAAA